MTDKKVKVVDGHVYNFYGLYAYEDQMVNYARMAKKFMNKPFDSPLDIVGNYGWHEAFPYEKHLFYDTSGMPLADFTTGKVIDFGCGPGRMVNRARKLFGHVDGIDISEYAIDYAREAYPSSKFYISSGIDVGDAPEDFYDIVYSTIAIQHIPCKTIRQNLFRGIHSILKPGGYMSIQVAYHPTREAGVWSPDTEHANYESDFWNARATNGHADMVINEKDLSTFAYDLGEIFDPSSISFNLVNVDQLYRNLDGHYHAPYWAESWLFVQARKV